MTACIKPIFYRCSHCGNLVQLLHNGGAPMICCGEPMKELVANSTDGAHEKHVPDVLSQEGRLEICIGAVEHPMLDAHHIEWIQLVTDQGEQRACLTPGDAPKASFTLGQAKPLAVYAYCNLHGLWVKEL